MHVVQYSKLDGMKYETTDTHDVPLWQVVTLVSAVVFIGGKVLQLW